MTENKEYEFDIEYNPEYLSTDQMSKAESKKKIQINLYSEVGKENTNQEIINLESNEKTKKNNKETDIKNIKILVHDSKYIIKIQSERFRMCLGYLVIPRVMGGNSYLGGGKNSSFKSSIPSASSLYTSSAFQVTTGIDKLYKDLLSTLKKFTKEDILIDQKELKDLISRAIAETEEPIIQIRYVPTHRMEHFILNPKRFFPYGEGIFFKINFAAKLLIALETALTVRRISDASERRIIYVESNLPRNVKNLIEDIKEKMTKKKHSLDSFGSISSIPSMITSYEDYYIPQNNGKRFVDIEQVTPSVSLRDASDELGFFRDQLVSALDVPPSFIGLEENLSNKNALSFESILFARTITNYQSKLGKNVFGLFSKIYNIVYNENIPRGVTIQLPKPKMLQIKRESEYMNTVATLINTLKELGIPEDYLKRKYLPFDWEEVERIDTEANIDKNLEKKNEDEMGLGGGYGGGMDSGIGGNVGF